VNIGKTDKDAPVSSGQETGHQMDEIDDPTAPWVAGLTELAAGRNGAAAGRGRSGLGQKHAEVTVHQLRIFWAVSHSATMTKAAKQLGMAQPSMSQQLAKLEATVGTKLFHRRSGELTLTEAGNYLLPRAEQVLRAMRELEDGLGRFSGGKSVTVRIAGINSVLRALLPPAMDEMHRRFPDADFDIQESAPGDTLEMLYGRRVNIGLLAANSVARDAVGFAQVPVVEDPQVLVVPEKLVLDGIEDPERELAPDDFALLNRTIQFVFGTQHDKRIEDWYDDMLPRHRIVAQCRSYELAIGLVRASTGVCIAPALSAVMDGNGARGLRLYRINSAARNIVALAATQYRRMEPYSTLLDLLQEAGAAAKMPEISPLPPFLDRPSLSEF
jgi:DNA-binding transcriptional LysR family regulator